MADEEKSADKTDERADAGEDEVVAPASSEREPPTEDEEVAEAVLRVRQGVAPVEFEWGGEAFEGRAFSLEDEREFTVEYRRAVSKFAKDNDIAAGDRTPGGKGDGKSHITEYATVTNGMFIEMRLRRGIVSGPPWWDKYVAGEQTLSYNDLVRFYQVYQEAVEAPFREAQERVLDSRGGPAGKPDA